MPDSSSAELELDTAVSSDAPQDSSPAPEIEGAKPQSMLDTVKAALGETPEESPASEESGDESQPKAEAPPPEDDKPKELTEEELRRYGKGAQNRIRGLVSERSTLQREVETLRPAAESFQRLTSFVQENGLSEQEVDLAISLAARMRNDPQGALEQFSKVYQDLATRAGSILPADLAEEVRFGYITESRARELATTRARAEIASQKGAEAAQRAEQAAQETQVRQFIGGVTSAIATWEQRQSAQDPDWNLKRDRIAELLELDFRRGVPPQNVQQAVEMADKARARVNDEFARLRPAPRPVNRPVVGSTSPRSTPAPKTMLDVVRMNAGS
jgi:hypothetical protein